MSDIDLGTKRAKINKFNSVINLEAKRVKTFKFIMSVIDLEAKTAKIIKFMRIINMEAKSVTIFKFMVL